MDGADKVLRHHRLLAYDVTLIRYCATISFLGWAGALNMLRCRRLLAYG